jgi:CBS domain-containing protein
MESKTVRDLMSSELVTVEEHESLSIADRVMKLGRIRHMPVVSGPRLIGLLSQRDLLHNALSEALGGSTEENARVLDAIRVADCMTKDPVTVSPETSLAEAAQVMLKYKYGCLPVVLNDELVGILTEADFVAAFAD